MEICLPNFTSAVKRAVSVIQEWIPNARKAMMEVPARVDDYIPRGVLDKLFFGYYVFQIVSTLGLDMQGTFPAFLYPSWVRSFHTHHCETWHDPFLYNTWQHPWYLAICLWEYTTHVPFYFAATYVYYQRIWEGVQCGWARVPTIMYCTQTITATTLIMLMAMLEDFSDYSAPTAPAGFFQRLKLAGVYSLFFCFCLLNLLDVLTETSSPSKKKKNQD